MYLYYTSSLEHLEDELQCLELRLGLELRKNEGDSAGLIGGIGLSRQEAVRLLGAGFPDSSGSSMPELSERLQQNVERIARRRAASLTQGIDLALVRLSNLFHLTAFEEQVVLLCLAPELDRKYTRIYAYLQDDLTQTSPTVDLVFRLLVPTLAERNLARRYFAAQARLCYLLRIHDPAPDGHGPLLSRCLKLDDRIVGYLLGEAVTDPRLAGSVKLYYPAVQPATGLADSDIAGKATGFLAERMDGNLTDRLGAVFYFYGPDGAGRQETVMEIGRRLGLPVVCADMIRLGAGTVPLSEAGRLLAREAVLHQAALCLTQFDCQKAVEEAGGSSLRMFLEELTAAVPIFFILGDRNWQPQPPLANCSFIACPFTYPAVSERTAIWRQLSRDRPLAAGFDPESLAGKFKFTPGQVRWIWQLAEDLAQWQNPTQPEITQQHLYQACQMLSDQTIRVLARQVDTRHTWDHLVLPPDQLEQLHELVDQVQNRPQVLSAWGFERRLTLGKGVNALFTGPPGCGKTLAAEVIAAALHLCLYKIDLSRVVSKFIGETEKNLAAVFEAAERANAILFFDEADALFGKRSEVKDAHDRYANIETGFLLQKMEEFEGIGILATNLAKNMDDAFQRRMQFTVEFPFPDREQREAIWRRIFPDNAPLEEIDYAFLAERLKMAGGNIHNIALRAAFYAARTARGIGMRELLLASRREYQKMGKAFLKNDFEPYYHLIGAE